MPTLGSSAASSTNMTVVVASAVLRRAVAANPNPSTPAFRDDMQWITAYLGIHMLSVPSRRYAYLLWFVIALVFIAVSLPRLFGMKAGYATARWHKFAIRRRTWKSGAKGRRYTLLLFPSYGQMISMTALFIVTAVACCVGPDYINPIAGTFNLAARSTLSRRAWDPATFVSYAPQYTIQKAWWTVGGRVGMIAFALFPLCVLFALKSPPFAIFAIPNLAQFSFDKLGRMHRWTAWIIYLLVLVHVAFWSMQLWNDKRPNVFVDDHSNQKRAFTYAWSYYRFLFAWTVCLYHQLKN
jgi:hypothetical protein